MRPAPAASGPAGFPRLKAGGGEGSRLEIRLMWRHADVGASMRT